jgi:hypothetical protein
MKQIIISERNRFIAFWLLVALLVTMLSSCGTRKVNINKVKKDSLSQIYTKIVTKEDINIETKNDVTIDEFTITPLDTCKDIVIDGKTYKNAVLSYKKTKDNTIQVQDIKVSKNNLKLQETKVSTTEKVKSMERTYEILLILIPILLWLYYEFKIR